MAWFASVKLLEGSIVELLLAFCGGQHSSSLHFGVVAYKDSTVTNNHARKYGSEGSRDVSTTIFISIYVGTLCESQSDC